MRAHPLLVLLAVALAGPAVALEPQADSPATIPPAAVGSLGLEDVARAGRHRDAQQVPSLITALQQQDGDVELRCRAAWALGRIKDPQAVPALVGVLEHGGNTRLRREAALALGALGGQEAERSLAAVAARDGDEQVVAASLEALGQTGGDVARTTLAKAAKDPRPLVSLSAKRTASFRNLKPLPTAPAAPQAAFQPSAAWTVCRNGQQPPTCVYRRGRSSGPNANALFIAGGAVLGGLSGAFAGDAIRPSRTGLRISTYNASPTDNFASPLERVVLGGMGAALGAGTAALWTLVDDVTFTRLSLIGVLTLEAAAAGAGAGLAFRWPRNATAFSMIGLAGATAVGATGITLLPHDFSFGDVAWVWGNAALGTGAGMLAAMVIIPSGVGRTRNHPGRIRDLGDLAGLSDPVFPFPWGEVGRLELVLASGLVTGAAATAISASTLGFYEVGVTRVMKTVGAALLTAMMVGLPPMLLLPDLPAPLPSTERVAAGLALASGAVAGAVVFALSSNDDGQGPLFYLDTGRSRPSDDPPAVTPSGKKAGSASRRRLGRSTVALAPPGLAVVPPMPGSTSQQPGVYVGLVNARF